MPYLHEGHVFHRNDRRDVDLHPQQARSYVLVEEALKLKPTTVARGVQQQNHVQGYAWFLRSIALLWHVVNIAGMLDVNAAYLCEYSTRTEKSYVGITWKASLMSCGSSLCFSQD